MAAALMTPSVALGADPTSASDPYGSTSETTPETDTTTETTPETDTTTETTPDTDTTTETTPAELAVFDPGPCVGAYVTASGSGFNPGETIDLSRDGVTVLAVAAGADGTFAVRVDIAGVQNGEHVITATGTTSGFSSSGTFDVEPQVCTSESGTTVIAVVVAAGSVAASSDSSLATGSLATTGFPVAPVLALAVLALLVGTMLLVATRNRRSLRPADSQGPSHL